ncbi:MAG: threonylcarbamoyl-AMP synthase [Oscillospiraceae bacterium]|jgi:L-threonylcarbamoyladenylate synthase|nr:threonylcarbamoyl-AMP synthase [Oscillospiraceae bacterium]
MITRVLTPEEGGVSEAAAILRAGGLVAIPTETVYGLAADALSQVAAASVFEAKGRPQDNPLIVHIAGEDMLSPLVPEIPGRAKALMEAFWPGPLTIILPKSDNVPDSVTAGLPTVAVRMPSHPVALAVIWETGRPLAAPSANRSGFPSPTAAAHCLADLNGRIPLILDGGSCEVGVESTVVTLCGKTARILRPGAVTPGDIAAVLGGVEIDPAVTLPVGENETVSSPGMKYRHYAPRARVIILEGDDFGPFRRLPDLNRPGTHCLVFEEELADCPVPALSLGPKKDCAEHARRLFAALRELDDRGAELICARVAGKGEGSLAVYNRMLRAAGFEVIRGGDVL